MSVNMQLRIIPFLISIIQKNITNTLTQSAAELLIYIFNDVGNESVIEFGSLEVFLDLLEYEYQPILKSALWGLRRLIYGNPRLRDYLVRISIIKKILEISKKIDEKSKLIQLIDYLLRENVLPDSQLEASIQLIPILTDCIVKDYEKDSDEEFNFYCAICSLSQLSSTPEALTIIYHNKGLITAIKKALLSQSDAIKMATITLIFKLMSSNDQFIQCFIDIGLPSIVLYCLKKKRKNKLFIHYLFKILQYICAGSELYVKAILYEQDMIQFLFQTVQNSNSKNEQTQALIILQQSLIWASLDDINYLFQMGLLQLLYKQVQITIHKKQLNLILKSLEILQKRGLEQVNVELRKLFQKGQQWIEPLFKQNDKLFMIRTKRLIRQINRRNQMELEEEQFQDKLL